jgi:hydrogenase expression/formation protein HypE
MLRNGINLSADYIRPGDKVIVTGTVGEHGCTIFLAQGSFEFETDIVSDCAPLRSLLEPVLTSGCEIHAMRDPTRGGLAATLNELAVQSGTGIILYDEEIPVRESVQGLCEVLGLDPLYLANEGKMVMVVPAEACDDVMTLLTSHLLGKDARIIGDITDNPSGRVLLQTSLGRRILDMPILDQIPRIC